MTLILKQDSTTQAGGAILAIALSLATDMAIGKIGDAFGDIIDSAFAKRKDYSFKSKNGDFQIDLQFFSEKPTIKVL